MTADAVRTPLPLLLIRGFGGMGVEDEKKMPYQGFNDGTVYPRKRGPNYIYEGMILRFMKSDWQYQDATNVIGYYGKPVVESTPIPDELAHFDPSFFYGTPAPGEDPDSKYKIIVDPAMALYLLRTTEDPLRTLWVFRYYDLDERRFPFYGQALVRLIDFIRALAAEKGRGSEPLVNVIAHSMGGLIVREAIQRAYPDRDDHAADYINKVVTLGTPHRGISFSLAQGVDQHRCRGRTTTLQPRLPGRPQGTNGFCALRRVLSRSAATDGGRNQLSQLRGRRLLDAESPLLGRGRGRTELQPERRAGQADVRTDPGLSAYVRAQVPRRP